MSLPRYASIARTLNIPLCQGRLKNGQLCHASHYPGSYSVKDRLVHWRDRTPTRAGIRRFLHLAGMLDAAEEGRPDWVNFYLGERMAIGMGRHLKLELPGAITHEYKRQLRAMIAGTKVYHPLREEALFWATHE